MCPTTTRRSVFDPVRGRIFTSTGQPKRLHCLQSSMGLSHVLAKRSPYRKLNTLARMLAGVLRIRQPECCGQLVRCLANGHLVRGQPFVAIQRLRTCALGGGAVVIPCATHTSCMGWRAYKTFQPAVSPVARHYYLFRCLYGQVG
jgi:hypothetical protein